MAIELQSQHGSGFHSSIVTVNNFTIGMIIDANSLSGYRPTHKVRDDYLTTGLHVYIEVDMAWPGDTVIADIKFISAERYPSCLWIGKIINIQECSRTVGYAKLLKIYNKALEKTS